MDCSRAERRRVVIGQAIGIVEIVGSVALGAILLLIVWQAAGLILPKASTHASTQAATNANDWLTIGAEQAIPVFFVFVIVLGGIARAAFQRRVRP